MKLRLLIISFILLILQGCASVPMASLQKDSDAKQFKTSPEKSNIYVYRNETFGGAIPLTLNLDGRFAGQTGPYTYFFAQVDPGQHEVTSVAEDTSNLRLITEPGKSYFVWQEVKMGLWTARSRLQEVDANTGAAAVQKCKMIESPIR